MINHITKALTRTIFRASVSLRHKKLPVIPGVRFKDEAFMISESDIYNNNFETIHEWAKNNNTNVPLGSGTPLGLACFEGKIKTVKMLVKYGSDPNYCYGKNWSPLIYASNNCRVNVIKYLLSIGADIHATDNHGNTALHHLCFCHRNDVTVAAFQLIKAGVDIHAKNSDGKLAKDLAEENEKFLRHYKVFVDMLTNGCE